jgi:hypothetical protein
LYTGPITVPLSETLYAVAGGGGYTDSAIGTASYIIVFTQPVYAPCPQCSAQLNLPVDASAR